MSGLPYPRQEQIATPSEVPALPCLSDEVRGLLAAEAVAKLAQRQAQEGRRHCGAGCCRPANAEHRPELAKVLPRPISGKELLAPSRPQAHKLDFARFDDVDELRLI